LKTRIVILATLVAVNLASVVSASASDQVGKTEPIVCSVVSNQSLLTPSTCPNVIQESYQVDVIHGIGPVSFIWDQTPKLSRMYWGASYATSSEYLYYAYIGKAKAAANIYNGLRIIQVCIWYTRAGLLVSDVACSTASSDTGAWLPGNIASVVCLDSLDPNAPTTFFNVQTSRIDPNVY
jgi:hypothetical protein